MKERRGAARRRATGIADSVAAAVRRRAQARESRVLVYDRAGEPRVLRPGSEAHDDVLATAELLIELVVETRDEEDLPPQGDEAATSG